MARRNQCLLFLPACLLGLGAAVLAGAAPDCSCSAFCAGHACDHGCTEESFKQHPPNGMTCIYKEQTAVRVPMYRITPATYTPLANTNTGDGPGDLSYIISARFLNRDGQDAIILFTNVLTDGVWGPYEFCNSDHGDWTRATCTQIFDFNPTIHNISYYDRSCDCPRAHESVGMISQAFINAAYPEFGDWAKRLGGYWYSLTKRGQCKEGQQFSEGCSWRQDEPAIHITAACLYKLLDDAVESHAATCFAGCKKMSGHLDEDCYQRCWFIGIDGDASLGISALSKDELMAIWNRAFTASPIGCVIDKSDPTLLFL